MILNSTKSRTHQASEETIKMNRLNGGCDETSQAKKWDDRKVHMASVVHDEICPTLTFLLHDMYWIEKNADCRTVKTRANQCIDQLTNAMNRCRSVLLDLRPNDEGPSLSESLKSMIANFQQISDLAVSSKINPDINLLGREQQSAVYRSVQEALSNALKHSHAQHINVTAEINLPDVKICIEDDGVGLGCVELSPAFCIGIKVQKQRARDLDGHFSIENHPNGKGTKTQLIFPLNSNLMNS